MVTSDDRIVQVLSGALLSWLDHRDFFHGFAVFFEHTGSLSSTTVAAVAEFHCSYLQSLAETGEKP